MCPERETEGQPTIGTPLYLPATRPREAAVVAIFSVLPLYRLSWSLPFASHTDLAPDLYEWAPRGAGRSLYRPLTCVGPARFASLALGTGWLGPLGRVAVGHRSGPHPNGLAARCQLLPPFPFLPSRLGPGHGSGGSWLGSGALGSVPHSPLPDFSHTPHSVSPFGCVAYSQHNNRGSLDGGEKWALDARPRALSGEL